MSSPLPARRILGVIPARFDSERLPGKVLRPICGKAMVHIVFERAKLCPLLDELWVATDSERVRDYCARNQLPVLMTASTHRSGTERILEVMQKMPADVYVNVQGDEPMLTAEHLRLLIEPLLPREPHLPQEPQEPQEPPLPREPNLPRKPNPPIQVTTLKTPLAAAEAQNPNVVKVVTNLRGEALYFSRAPVPYRRNPASGISFYKHLGLYAYSREALERYRELPPSPLEQTERLEQLRFLENGIPIQVAETAEDTIGVDTEEDWAAATKYFEGLRAGR